jgi:hypothetical protein
MRQSSGLPSFRHPGTVSVTVICFLTSRVFATLGAQRICDLRIVTLCGGLWSRSSGQSMLLKVTGAAEVPAAAVEGGKTRVAESTESVAGAAWRAPRIERALVVEPGRIASL